MGHNLFGERFIGYREPAWHKLGLVIEERISLPDAVEMARANFGIIKAPKYAKLNGKYVELDGIAIIREPTPDDNKYVELGQAKEGYTFLQNMEIAERFNPLTDKWPLETIGVLGKGETIFMVLDAGTMEIGGQEVRCFFLITDTRDGRTSMSIHFTPLKTVCQNTLEAGKAAAVATADLRHTASLEDEVAWRVGLLGEMQNVADKVIHSYELMTQVQMTPRDVTAVLKAAYPYPRKPKKVEMLETLESEEVKQFSGLLSSANYSAKLWENAKARADERRDLVKELFGKLNDSEPENANTPWHLYNAVVEFEDFREPQGKETEEDADYAVLFGERAKTKARAYEAAVKLTERKL